MPSSTTPLLLLLDSVLCQDREQLETAMYQIRALLQRDVPCHLPLSAIVGQLLAASPNLAMILSEHDSSLPLHFAASIGDTHVAELLIASVSWCTFAASIYLGRVLVLVKNLSSHYIFCPRMQNPRATRTPNEKGKIPLHYAAREGRSEMVQYLLRVDPCTASMPSKKDKLAVHFASGEGHLGVVRALLRVHPGGAAMSSNKGKLPLHFAARWGHMSVAQHLLSLFPEGIKGVDWEGSLPLHDAAREGQAVMSQFLIDKWPEALQATSLRGEIPLFSAVRSGNLSFVVCLLKAWHTGGKHILQNVTENDAVEDWDWNILELCLRGAESNFNGCTMLSIKCVCECDCGCALPPQISVAEKKSGDKKRARVSLSLSKKRLRGKEEDAKTECACVFYPVHAALRANVNARVLRAVLDKSGQDLVRQDCVGALPIHVAVSNVTNKNTVQVCLEEILGKHPESARIRDNAKRLPLHRALESNADFAFVKALVDVYPRSVVEPYLARGSNSAMKSPMAMALERDCDLSTIFFLLQRDPNFVKQSFDFM